MIRGVCILVGAVFAILALLLTIGVRTQPRALHGWKEFAIGPASGRSTNIGPAQIVSEGMNLREVLAVAYSIPRTRIIGPSWLAEDQFAVIAVAAPAAADSLRPLLQRELANRLALTAHVEDREFAGYVLSARDGPRNLELAAGKETYIEVHDRDLRARATPLGDFANVLQGILGKPVVDETGIAGRFNMQLTWGEDRERTIAAALESRLGLQLTPGNRRLPALIVDHADRGTALALISGMGRMTSVLPAAWRMRFSEIWMRME